MRETNNELWSALTHAAKLQCFYDAVMERRAAGYELLAYDGDSDTYGPDALDDLIKEMQ